MSSWIDLIEEPPPKLSVKVKNHIFLILGWPINNFLVIIIIIVILALIIGFIGFMPLEINKNTDFVELIYNTLRLLVSHDTYGKSSGDISPEGQFFHIYKKDLVNFANLLTLVVALYFFLSIIITVLKSQINILRIKRSNSHVVICGLSDKGYQLTIEFRKKGKKVIIIEHNKNNNRIVDIENIGALVLIGDARNLGILKDARVYKAEFVIATSNDDLVNISVAIGTHDLCKQFKNNFNFEDISELSNLFSLKNIGKIFSNLGNSLVNKFNKKHTGINEIPVINKIVKGDTKTQCIIHLKSFELKSLIQYHEIFSFSHPLFELQIFNIYENISRYFFFQNPPYELQDTHSIDSPPIHYLVIGFNDLTEALVLQAAKVGHFPNEKLIHFTIVDPESNQKKIGFHNRYPKKNLDKVVTLDFIASRIDDFQQKFRVSELNFDNELTAIIITEENDVLSLNITLNILEIFKETNTKFYVYIKDDVGLTKFLSHKQTQSIASTRIRLFGMKESVSTIQMVIKEKLNILAREIHMNYLNQPGEDEESKNPWELLPDHLKNSNKQQADHIPVKIHLIGAKIRKIEETSISNFQFTEKEIEFLARIEHNRWSAIHYIAGWELGYEKSHQLKIHTDLVDYDDLDEKTKDFDRNAVKKIPGYLKSLNLEIIRNETAK